MKHTDYSDRYDRESDEAPYMLLTITLQEFYGVNAYVEHTGGGVFVIKIDLSKNKVVLVTLDDDNTWTVGKYDTTNSEDEGIGVASGLYFHQALHAIHAWVITDVR